MSTDRKKKGAHGAEEEAPQVRHRLGGVVHDERGRATAILAPLTDAEATASRQALRLADDAPQRPRKRTDLRKLSEWIKLQRDLAKREPEDG